MSQMIALAATTSSVSLLFSAALAIFVSFTAPLVMIAVNNRSRKADREAEWAHQETLAKRAERVAKATSDKVDVVHVLVNSDKTASMQRELDSAEREVVMMRQIYQLHLEASEQPDETALGVIEATEGRIAELRAELVERQRQGSIVADQIKQNPDAAIGEP